MIKLIFNKNLMNIKHLTYMKTIIKPQLNKGKLLLSQPLISDEFFHNSVVFISEYSDDGIVGFIVNKPLNFEIFDFSRRTSEHLLKKGPKWLFFGLFWELTASYRSIISFILKIWL